MYKYEFKYRHTVCRYKKNKMLQYILDSESVDPCELFHFTIIYTECTPIQYLTSRQICIYIYILLYYDFFFHSVFHYLFGCGCVTSANVVDLCVFV